LPSRRYSLPFTPTSATFTIDNDRMTVLSKDEEEGEFENEKQMIEKTGVSARNGRQRSVRTRWDTVPLGSVKVDKPSKKKAGEERAHTPANDIEDMERPAFWALMRAVLPTIPHKPLLLLGLLICVLSGAMTPIFSYFISRLLFEVSVGAQNVSVINRFGCLVLGLAALDGLLLGSKFVVMESVAVGWTTRLRTRALARVLAQDKRWFDRPLHAPARLVQVLVKDGEDARSLVAVVWGQFFVVAAMLGVGLVWALVRGWQLTLAGFAIAPVFAVTMAVQTRLVARCEVRNKRAREEVARGYYDVCFLFSFFLSFFFD
jgi:ATP-binding cassette subfamily B (MDR/TAP) protein 1